MKVNNCFLQKVFTIFEAQSNPMKKNTKLLILVFAVCSLYSSQVKSQDTLRLLNGNVLDIKFIGISGVDLNYSEMFKGKSSIRTKDLSTVFSYKLRGEKEKIIYEYNPEAGNKYKIDEMRDFMEGQRQADRFYHSRTYNYIGLAAGLGAGYLLADDQSPVFFVTPLIYSAIIIAPGIKVKRNEMNKDLIDKVAYRDGYRKVARSRKFLGSFAYSGLSMLASYLAFSAID